MVYSAKSDDIETISQFTRIKYIYITTNGSSTQVNYQVKLTIVYEPEMQADFSDIRFNTLGNVYIDYWIESKTDSVTATVWVELPDTITDPGSGTIWMCYGNSGLSDKGNGDDTFDLFSNFNSALNGSKWTTRQGAISTSAGNLELISTTGTRGLIDSISTFSHPHILECRAKTNGNFTNGHVLLFRTPNSWNDIGGDIFNLLTGPARATFQTGDAGSYNVDWHKSVSEVTNWHNYKIEWYSGTSKAYQDDVLYSTSSTHVPTEDMSVSFYEGSAAGDIGYVDWVFIRKYITNEPTISYGTSQHQRRTPQFIG